MKICRIVDKFPSKEEITGDLGPNYYYLSKLTAEEGFDMHVICGRTKNQKSFEEVDGVKVHRVCEIENLRSVLWGDFARKALQKVLEIKPDIIHGHNIFHNGCIRSKHELHAMVITHYHGILNSFKYKDYLPLMYDFKTSMYDRIIDRFSFYQTKQIMKDSDSIIAVSNAGANSIRKYFPDKNIKVIYNGIDLNVFHRVDSDVKDKLGAEHLLLFVGRPMPLKGIQYLLEATKILSRKFKGLKVLLLGVDRPDSQIYLRWLREIAKKSGLDNVIFSKGVPYTEMPKYYSAADCFVLPTLSEGLSKVLLEAQACSCPVVATNMGSNPEIVIEKGGLLCEPRSSSNLAEKITEVFENKERYDGSEFVKAFTWERNVEEMIKLYEQINSYFFGLG
jgi:glycosyltransferase involved in cell wall biosynthesis